MVDNNLTMYSTPWCGYCIRLKHQLKREGISFTEINIAHDSKAARLVEQANGGNQTVPTVVLADGTTFTNPSLRQIKQHVATAL